MGLLNRLILVELVGPFVFGVALFTALLMSAVYLFVLTSYFVNGIPFTTVLHLMALQLPGLVSWTFPMASLLAVLLGFGRLSGDSELIAVFASGVNLWRIVVPVLIAGVFVSSIGLVFSEEIVPRASYSAAQLKAVIVKRIGETTEIVFLPTRTKERYETVVAAGASPRRSILYRVTWTQYDPANGKPKFVAYSPKAEFVDGTWRFDRPEWLFQPTGALVDGSGGSAPYVGPKLPKIAKSPEELIQDMVPQENLSSAQILARIAERQREGKDTQGLEVEYYNKFAVPLASMVFCLVGAPLGIRNPRRSGAALGWISAIGIIIAYWVLMRFMGVLGSGGAVAPWLAAFAPNIVGIFAAILLLWRRSR